MVSTSQATLQANNTAPCMDAYAVTTNDTTPLTNGPCRAIWIGGSGNLKVTLVSGNSVTFTGVLAGTWIPVQATIIWATGTTAANLVAMY